MYIEYSQIKLFRNQQEIVWTEIKIPVHVKGHKLFSDYVAINFKSIIRKVLTYYSINYHPTTL